MLSDQTESVSGRVPAELAHQLDQAAEETDVTKSQLVREAVE